MGSNAVTRPAEAPEALPADFDKAQFEYTINVKALKVPAKQCQQYMKLLNKHLLNKPRVKNVLDAPGEADWRLVLLEEGLEPQGFAQRSIIQKGAPATSTEPMTLQSIIDRDSLQVTDATVQLGYDHISTNEVLRRLLPEGCEVPSSYEQVGHIVHLNLRDELLPYRRIIGKVLLEKNPKVETVINKVGTIENEWRVFQMDVLAGNDNTIAEVRQHGLRFNLDFRKVYWNSRLEAEHQRLVEKWFQPGQVVADAMAGVGPFAVPAGKKGCKVLANDLNPDSYKWLVENIKINKVGHVVCPYNLDGREFMREAAGGRLQVDFAAPPPPPQKKKKKDKAAAAEGEDQQKEAAPVVVEPGGPVSGPIPAFHHIVMNLPATAVEFLDALNGSFDADLWKGRDLPMVHVYAFLKKDETLQDLQRRIEAALGDTVDSEIEFFSVRDVAPNKQMYCASFRVPEKVAFAKTDGEAKRQKVG